MIGNLGAVVLLALFVMIVFGLFVLCEERLSAWWGNGGRETCLGIMDDAFFLLIVIVSVIVLSLFYGACWLFVGAFNLVKSLRNWKKK